MVFGRSNNGGGGVPRIYKTQEAPFPEYAVINFGAFWRILTLAPGDKPRYATDSVNYMQCLIS